MFHILQRFDYNVLKPFLPPKHEFVISVGLSDLQAKLYEYYIENKSQIAKDGGAMRLFKDYQVMRLIWTHPLAMRLSADRHQKIQDKVLLVFLTKYMCQTNMFMQCVV